MKIFITGIAGFIGSHLAESLRELGFKVSGIDNFNNYYNSLQKRKNAEILKSKNINIFEYDLLDNNLEDLVKNSSFVYHLAAQPGISEHVSLETYTENNIYGTQKLIEACEKLENLKLFINISTSSVYGKLAISDENFSPKPISFYGVTKLAAEQLVFCSHSRGNLPACSFRLFSVYGPRERPDKLFPKIIKNTLLGESVPIYEGSEKHLRSFTYVKDIVNGLLLPLENINNNINNNINKCNGEIFNLGNSAKISTQETIEIIEKILCKKIKIERKPKRTGDQLETHANITKIQEILNYSPNTSFENGIEETIKWYLASQ